MSDTKKVYYGQDAIAQVEQNIGRELTYAEKRVVEEEGYVATPYLDTKGIITQGVGQTGEWIEKGFEAAYQHHVDRAERRIPGLKDLPEALQAELIQAEYRGDLGTSPTFVRLLNEGNYEEASSEFLDNNDYRRSQEEGTGVHKRMKKVSDAVASYASEKRRAVPEAALLTDDFQVGSSGFSFLDGDTIINQETGERVRFPEIDLAELTKVTREEGYSVGEAGGEKVKQYVSYLANKYGYTNVTITDKEDKYGRKIGDLKDSQGNSFTNFLISAGIARPTFIGESTQMMSDDSYTRFLYGEGLRSLRKDEPQTDYELASELIKVAALAPTNGVPLAKMDAFNEEEYASFPDLFSGVVLRNKDANFDNTAKTPWSDAWEAGLSSAGNAFKLSGAAVMDVMGLDNAQAWLEGSAAQSRATLARAPKIKLSYKDVDWTSFDQITEFLGANVAMSLPFMGVTAASVLAAPFTYGTSLTVPVAMYSGMILEEMPGRMEDKSYGLALAGGTIAAALDRLGLKAAMGTFTPSHFLTGEAKEKALDAIISSGLAQSRQQAQQILANATKRELLSYIDDAGDFVKNQLTKGYILKQTGKRLIAAGGIEGSTEVLQELTQYTAAVLGSDKTWDYAELEERMANALIAGGMIGSSFSVPGAAFQAGSWKDAGVATSEYDQRFDDAATNFRQEAAEDTSDGTKRGVVPSITYKLNNVWRSLRGREEADRRSGRDPDSREKFDTIADAGEARREERTRTEKLKDALSDPIAALRTALDTRITVDMLQKSKALRLLYDQFGGRKNKTYGGVDFQNDKILNFTHFESFLRPIEDVLSSFKVKAKSYGKRKKAISALMYDFYLSEIKPITDGKGNRKHMGVDEILEAIDWNNLSKQEFTDNAQAIKEFMADLYAVDDAMFRNITAVQEATGETKIGNLQDHIFRSKTFLKSAIAKDRAKFSRLLQEEYDLSPDVANAVTDLIVDNPDVNTLDEAFDLTKGGIFPKTHKRRSLNISDNPKFSNYLEQDLFRNLENLMKGSARYMTMSRFIGRDSKVLMEQLRQVYQDLRGDAEVGSEAEIAAREAIEDIASDIRDLVNADSGNYKRIDNTAIRGAQKFLTVAATLSMLPLAAISSIVELALVSKGASLRNLHKNAGSFGILAGKEMYEYFRELGRISGVAPKFSTFDWQLKSRAKRLGEDYRHKDIDDPRKMMREAGFLSQKTGAATVVGVSETNQFTEALMNSFFKIIGLQGITNLTRTMRAAIYNDFLIENIDIIHRQEGKPPTNESMEAEKMLRYMGIPIDRMLELSRRLMVAQDMGVMPDEALLAAWDKEFNNGLINFINAAVPMPGAMSRPLFYSNPHFAMFTQFQGFISEFTANHLPNMWDTVKTANPGMKFSAFASIMSMLMLGYASQHLKDLIKFGESSPYLSDQEKYLRALYSTGLLGTTERIWSNNYVLPLYKDRSRNAGEAVWNLVSGEAPVAGIFENVVGFGQGVMEGSSRSIMKRGLGLTPLGPFKHRLYDTSVEQGWITGE